MSAAIYVRISSDRGGEALGVARQEKDCRRLCAENGFTVKGVYSDNDMSAADPRKVRPEYQRLLRDIQGGHIDAVVVWAEDRLHRRPIELEEFVDVCEASGVTQLVTVHSTMNFAQGDGMMFARVRAALAAEEVRKTRERIKRKHLELAEAGKPSGGGTRCFGYEADGMTIRKSEAREIRKAVKFLLDGGTIYAVRQDWMRRGVESVTNRRTVDGGVYWSQQAVRRNLSRPRIAGLRQHQGEVIGDAAWPAIIDRETWEALNALLNDPRRRSRPPSREYPLRGMLTCALCNSTLTSWPGGKGGRYYGCRKDSGGCGHVFVKAELVERYVIGVLWFLASSVEVQSLLESENETNAKELRKLLTAKVAEQANMARIDDDYGDGKVSAATNTRQQARAQKRIDAIEARLAAIRGGSAVGRLGPDLETAWPKMTMEERQTVMKVLVTTVQVHRSTKSGNKFDPARITFSWRSGRLAEVVGGAGDGTTGLVLMSGEPIAVLWDAPPAIAALFND